MLNCVTMGQGRGEKGRERVRRDEGKEREGEGGKGTPCVSLNFP